jgi:hypothetical protein
MKYRPLGLGRTVGRWGKRVYQNPPHRRGGEAPGLGSGVSHRETPEPRYAVMKAHSRSGGNNSKKSPSLPVRASATWRRDCKHVPGAELGTETQGIIVAGFGTICP